MLFEIRKAEVCIVKLYGFLRGGNPIVMVSLKDKFNAMTFTAIFAKQSWSSTGYFILES